MFTLSRCTPRCVLTVCSRRTGANWEKFRVRSYIPGSATDQTRFGAKKLSRYVPVMLQCITSVAPEAVQCVPVHPDTLQFCPRNLHQSPGVTTAGHRSRTAKARCFTVASLAVLYSTHAVAK